MSLHQTELLLQVAELIESLVKYDSKWLTIKPDEAAEKVIVELDIGGFIDTVIAVCLCYLPSPSVLMQTLEVAAFEVPFGSEKKETVAKRKELDENIDLICAAVRGYATAYRVTPHSG